MVQLRRRPFAFAVLALLRRRPFALAVLALLAATAATAASPAPARADGASDEGSGDGSGDENGAADPNQDAQVPLAGDAYADTDPSALTDFQPALDPHGTWADDPTYGTVWTPNPDEVGADFTPYVSDGHWAYDDDYVWESDYAWGWAAFHYGRWVLLRDRGWGWIPGRVYANAWVTWRIGDDTTGFVGWAPAPPTWGWRDGVAGLLGFASWSPFVFCPPQSLFAASVAPRVVSGASAAAVMPHTRPYVKAAPVVGPPAGPTPASLGLDPSRVLRVSRTDVALMHARQFARPSTALSLGAHAPVPHLVRPRLVARPSMMQRPAAQAQRPTRHK